MGVLGSALEFLNLAASPASPASGRSKLYVKTDGGLYLKNELGVERGLLTPDASIHLNPDFEQGVSFPSDWSNYWGSNGTWGFDTTTAIQGLRSVRVDSVSGTDTLRIGNQGVWACVAGSTVKVSFWAKVSVAGNVGIEFFSSTTAGNPDFFGSEYAQQNALFTASTSWQKFEVSFVIPAGHTKARFYLGASNNRTTWFDASGSIVTAQPAPVSEFMKVSGEISMWFNATPPPFHLILDGSEKAVATYPVLDSIFGPVTGRTNGSGGAGTTHFRLPDFRGRTPVGVGTATGAAGATAHTLNQKAGEETHVQTTAELAAHAHVQNPHTHVQNPHSHSVIDFSVASYQIGSGGPYAYGYANTGAQTATNQSTTPTEQNAGSSAAMNNMQPYIGIYYIVKT